MPWSTNTFSSLEPGDALAYCNNVSNNLMSWNPGERIPQEPLTYELITVADATGQDFHQDLALVGLLQVDIFESDAGALVLVNGGLIGLGERWSHYA